MTKKRPVGRPPAKDRMEKRFFRATQKQWDTIEKASISEGQNKSEWIRDKLMAAAT